MTIISANEARNICGFDSLKGSTVASFAFYAIKTSAGRGETSTSVEFRKFKLKKLSIKEGREIIAAQGFRVEVSESNGIVKLHISWFFQADKDRVIVL